MSLDFWWDTLWSSLRMASPLCFAALGGLLSERAGVINLALEGTMLIGAFTAAAVSVSLGSASLGFLCAGLAGALTTGILAIFCLHLRAQQVVIGMGLNLLAFGFTPYLNKIFFGVTSSTPSLTQDQRFTWEPLLILCLLLPLCAYSLKNLRIGLWLRTAGEEAKALDTSGISKIRVRWFALILGGISAGWGGAVLSTMLASQFSRQMTAGMGFMAIAALILGRWSIIPTTLVCLLFGLTDAIQMRLQHQVSQSGHTQLLALVQLLPYLVTLLILALQGGRMRAPRELGRPV
jgi:simple sugar transport system permease protein